MKVLWFYVLTGLVHMNQEFIKSQIRMYGRLSNVFGKSLCLISIGLHAGLLKDEDIYRRNLTREEMQRVIYFIKQFSAANGLPPIES